MDRINYLRFPHLIGDLLTFVAADDIWLAPVSGGRAWRLTDDRVPVKSPRLSPDGSHVAWLSQRDGHTEAYAAPVDGGATLRLTWWASRFTTLLGWTADGRVLVASSAREAQYSHQVVHAVGLDRRIQRLDVGPASGLAIRADGATVLSTVGSRPPAWWKRYRGGTAPKLWLDRAGDRSWTRLLASEEASLVDPLWVDGQLVFTSDLAARLPGAAHEVADLYTLDVDDPAAAPRRLTRHTEADGYVRDATTDGSRIVYHARGRIHLLQRLDAEPERLDIVLPGGAAGRSPRPLEPTRQLNEFRPDQGGDASLVDWRGNVLLLAHRAGPARAVAADSGVRAQLPRPLGSSGRLALVSDAGGADAVWIHAFRNDAEPRRLETGDLGTVLQLVADPAGERLAVISHDGTIRVVEVETGTTRTVGVSRNGEALDPTFSPDGRWLAWSEPFRPEAQHRLAVVDVTDPQATAVLLTSGRFHNSSPSFTLDGRYLAFLSARTLDPTYDSFSFDLGFGAATRPYLVPLSATEPAPFGPSADGWRISKDDDRDDRDDKPGDDTAGDDTAGRRGRDGERRVPPVQLDVDGFEERIVGFPVPSGNYRELRAVRDGVVWIRESGEDTPLHARRAGLEGDPPGDALEFWSFAQRELTELVDAVDHVTVSGDGRRLVVRDGDHVTVRPSGKAVEDKDADLVTVDLSRLHLELDPVAEWRQMFEENGRLMAGHYWRADLDGVDWPAVLDRYRPLLERLGSHDDLVDVLWETVGELNTSHAYVMPPGPQPGADRRLGLLGADLSPVEGGWRIDRILPGESSDPAARSPLRAAGVGARVGDVIVAVDGIAVDPVVGPARQLVGTADKPVELTLRGADDAGSANTGAADRRVVVVPVPNEEALRYQAWVAERAAYVRRASDGVLGYVHVPDMMSNGWAQLHRDLHVAAEADGLIVDVRYNRGGHTSQLVLERLARRVVGWAVSRHFATDDPYPSMAPRGPVVFVANEMAGSDGDIVNAGAQAMGLGPVVGTRTWGGVVGIDGRFSLVDGTGVTQPRYAFWLQGKGWGVENHGVDPDIEVVVDPADFDSPADKQLDRAIEEALRLLAETPAARPPILPPPRVG